MAYNNKSKIKGAYTPLPQRLIFRSILFVSIILSLIISAGCPERTKKIERLDKTIIITSDTILSGMISSLLPEEGYSVQAILPPGQCPGHYDIKLSDIEKINKADLIVTFKGMPFMDKTESAQTKRLVIDTGGNNWMTPSYYEDGLIRLAHELSKIYPEDAEKIKKQKDQEIKKVRGYADSLREEIKKAGISGKKTIASSMQRQPLEWMGFHVVADYGRPESLTTRDIVELTKKGRYNRIALVVDNLQSGPDTGKAIAESLGVPHVVLTNFPSERGYLATLRENVDAVLGTLN